MLSKGESCGTIFVISGSSGSGKTTLLNLILKRKEFKSHLIKIATVTTRKPRAFEQDGQDYQFVDRSEFLRRRREGEFVESQQIYGDYYGTPKRDLASVAQQGKDALLCIDVRGGLAIKRIFKQKVVLIFIVVTDIKKLKERLNWRSSENRASLRKRLQIVTRELKAARHYHYLIVNDVLKIALQKLSAVITASKLRVIE